MVLYVTNPKYCSYFIFLIACFHCICIWNDVPTVSRRSICDINNASMFTYVTFTYSTFSNGGEDFLFVANEKLLKGWPI